MVVWGCVYCARILCAGRHRITTFKQVTEAICPTKTVCSVVRLELHVLFQPLTMACYSSKGYEFDDVGNAQGLQDALELMNFSAEEQLQVRLHAAWPLHGFSPCMLTLKHLLNHVQHSDTQHNSRGDARG